MYIYTEIFKKETEDNNADMNVYLLIDKHVKTDVIK